MSDPQQSAAPEPPRWSLAWILKSASWVLLGQFRVPGWLGLIFAIFWGVPAWQSKVEFWAQVAKSSGGRLAPFAEILLWPYFSPSVAFISFVYLIVVSRVSQTNSTRNVVLATVAWISVTSIILTTILIVGWGAIIFYVRTEIAKGRAGVPLDSSPANSQANGSDRPLYAGPRNLTENQKRLLIDQSDQLKQLKGLPITYLAGDLEAFQYAVELRAAFQLATVEASQPSEQTRTDTKDVGIMIEVPDHSAPSGAAVALQQTLEVLDIHAKIIDAPSRFGSTPVILFVGPRPIMR
jgi:hypothetical protein